MLKLFGKGDTKSDFLLFVTTCALSKLNNIVEEVKQRRWRWLGHTLRMERTRHHQEKEKEEDHWELGEGPFRRR